MSNFASGARRDLSYVAESAYGTTPGAPGLQLLRTTGDTLDETRQANVSEEIRADRAIADVRHGQRSVAGDINFELSYGTFDDLLEATVGGTWTADVLKVGITKRSFTFERPFRDIGVYQVFRGCALNTFSLSLTPGGNITGTFNVLGRDSVVNDAELATPAAPTTVSPFDSFSGSLTEGGVSAPVSGLTLQLANGLEQQFLLFDKGASGFTLGRSNVTGTVTAYFTDKTLLEKFLNESESALLVTLSDPSGNQYQISLPRIKYTGATIPVEGEGSLQINLPFQALHDGTEQSAIVITRTPAVTP